MYHGPLHEIKEGLKLDKKSLETSLITAEANACAICELLSAVRVQAMEVTKQSIIDDNACYSWISENYDIVRSAVYACEQIADSSQNDIESAYMRVHCSEESTSSEASQKAGGPPDIVGMVNDALADADSIRLILGAIEDTGVHFRSLCHASTSIPPDIAEDLAGEMQHFSAISDDYRQKVEATLREILFAIKKEA